MYNFEINSKLTTVYYLEKFEIKKTLAKKNSAYYINQVTDTLGSVAQSG